MKHSIFSNIKYVYQASFEKTPRIKWLLLVDFWMELLVPFSATITTSLVVYAITNDIQTTSYVLLVSGLAFLTFLVFGLRNWAYLTYTFENIFTRNTTFMVRLTEHQLTTDYENVEPKERHDIISKAFEAIGSNMYGIELMMRNAPEALYNLVGMIIYGVLIILYSPIILVVLGVMTILNIYLTSKANKYLSSKRDRIGKLWDEKYYVSKDITNHVNGKDVRLYQMKEWFYTIFVSLTKERKTISKHVEKRFLFANLSDTIFLCIRDIIAYTTLTALVIDGQIDLATYTFLIGIVTGFTLWLNGFVKNVNNLRSSNIATNEYRECLQTKNTFNHGIGLDISTLSRPLQIEFKNVSFSYPNQEQTVLDNVSFTIKQGEKIALVGENGAGKTTLVKLLCGMYQPTSGDIFINGHTINEFNIDEYMSLLSVVFQDSEPLAFTIAQNIACTTKEHMNQEKVQSSIEQAGLADKVSSLPQKENTYITQMFHKEGIKLSGGEIQKLMLARAIYKDSALLILDEPTAALDPISEEQMYLRYEEYIHGNTSIFISHRLSSTKFCDRIFFLQDGSIVESGSHQELMSKDSHYKELFDIQSQYYKEEDSHEEYQS